MLLQEIKIEGFRSLKSVTWKPGRLNVLIGPNGGGKSNLLSALDLLRVAATGGLRDAILRMGGMAPLVWDGTARKMVFTLRLSDENTTWEHNLELIRLGVSGDFEASFYGPSLDPEIGMWSIHRYMRVDEDAELRKAAVTRSEKHVSPDGQNLIAVLHTLYESHPEFETFVDDAMEAAFPDDYKKLSFPPAEDGRTQMRIRRKHRKRDDSASDLSDGTLRFLLLLAILGNPDPAPLIAIDEPETGLHPRMLPIIGAIAANCAAKSQIIFNTHSPQFLDAFEDEIPTTTVATWNGSETILKTLAGEELKRWVENYSLGKFAFSGEAELAS